MQTIEATDPSPFDLKFFLKDGLTLKQHPCYFWIFLVEFCARFAKLGGMRKADYKASIVEAVVEKWVVLVELKYEHTVRFFDSGIPILRKSAVSRLQQKIKRVTNVNHTSFPILLSAFSYLGKRNNPSVSSTEFLSVHEIADKAAAEVIDWFIPGREFPIEMEDKDSVGDAANAENSDDAKHAAILDVDDDGIAAPSVAVQCW